MEHDVLKEVYSCGPVPAYNSYIVIFFLQVLAKIYDS